MINKIPLLSVIYLGLQFFITSCDSNKHNPNINFPDGPDKALLQNLHMIRDPQTNSYPFQRLKKAKDYTKSLRSNQNRDFNWQQINTNIPGRSRSVYYHDETDILFSGSVSGGLWKNSNFKSNAPWTKVDGFSGVAVNTITKDAIDNGTIYIGTGESHTAFINYRESSALGNGIYKSIDDGDTWSHLDTTNNFYYVNDLVTRDEEGQNVIYAAVGSGEYETGSFANEGLYRSTDQGASWQEVMLEVGDASINYEISDLEINGNQILAATKRNSQDQGGATILSSLDGVNWNVIKDFGLQFNPEFEFVGRSLIKAAPSNANHLYAIYCMGGYNNLDQLRDYSVFLAQSLDGGSNWLDLPVPSGGYNIPWHALSLTVDPNDENKIFSAGLDNFVLNDASRSDLIPESWLKLSFWQAMYYTQSPEDYDLTPEELDYWRKVYVHADIHDIVFYNSNSDEAIIATDGGIFRSENLSSTVTLDDENQDNILTEFYNVNNQLNTTQYYHGSIHPEINREEAVGGTQDNGSILVNWSEENPSEKMISGGDGGFSFFDYDDDVVITMVYGNRYYIHYQNQVIYLGDYVNGLFLNPVAYDQTTNLLYSNTASSSYGGLYTDLKTRFRDTLQIVNINPIIGKDDLGLETYTFIKLDQNLEEAITAISIDENSEPLARSLVFGTETGKVFKATNLPYNTSVTPLNFENLPSAYISSIDIGDNPDHILLTFSNFGISSVWVSNDGGNSWEDLERNLPDMPVRWGRFNPEDDNKILIATELGIWGLEAQDDVNEQWANYNVGFPNIRVDMFDIRAADNKILAATHGQGFLYGTIDQGNSLSTNNKNLQFSKLKLYPNPVDDVICFDNNEQIKWLKVFDFTGKEVFKIESPNQNAIDVSFLNNGVYFVKIRNIKNQVKTEKIFKN